MPSTKFKAEKPSSDGPRYPTEDIKQGPFSFGPCGFLFNQIPRESAKSLKRLLYPEMYTESSTTKLTQDDDTVIDASWIEAQLQHYGIQYHPDIGPFKAKALLLTSLSHGLCDTVPPQVLKVRTLLEEKFKAALNDYDTKYAAYQSQLLPMRIHKFKACGTPAEEAKCDASLFLRKRFLDENGNPAMTKTPDVLLLPGFTDKHQTLTRMVERVPALHIAFGDIVAIGWNRKKVNDLAVRINKDYKISHDDFTAPSDPDRQMMDHHVLTANIRKDRKKLIATTLKSRELEALNAFDPGSDTAGCYIIKADSIAATWAQLSDNMTLRMIHPGRLAVFDLGIIAGMMVLGRSTTAVAKRIERGNWSNEDEGTDSDSDNTDTSPNTTLTATGTGPPPSKRQKLDHARRLHFRWRGYNTVSANIMVEKGGWLEFTNEVATAFEGRIEVELLDGECGFRGFRVPGAAGQLTMDWDELSG
ncbi:MAG: hypothetical protein Q9194_007416, partial [Teloschistes cf. exilis]